MLRSIVQSYKNAYSGLSRSSWMLSLVMLVNRSGTMVVPFMSVYTIQKLHFTLVQSGWVMALFGIGSLGGSFLGGKLTDKISFYNVQICALLIGGTLFIVLGYQHTFTGIGIVTLILSLGNESFRPANSAAIAHYSEENNKTRSYSLNRLAVNLGWAVGGGLGGLLASVNYQLLFWVDGLTNFFAAVLVLTLMPRPVLNIKENSISLVTIKSVSAYKDGPYLFFIVLATLFSCCFYEFFITQPVFYTLQWHFNERFIGFLLALNGLLIVLIEMILVHILEEKRPPLFYISLGVLLTGLSFVLLAALPHHWLTALLIVAMITLGEIISMPFMNSFWVSRTTPFNRGSYAALYGMSWATAQIISPYLGSLVITRWGFDTLWWVLSAICCLSAAGYFLMLRTTDKKGEPNEYVC